jgi:hypothetical protein
VAPQDLWPNETMRVSVVPASSYLSDDYVTEILTTCAFTYVACHRLKTVSCRTGVALRESLKAQVSAPAGASRPVAAEAQVAAPAGASEAGSRLNLHSCHLRRHAISSSMLSSVTEPALYVRERCHTRSQPSLEAWTTLRRRVSQTELSALLW